MNAASGITMQWIRNLAKTSICIRFLHESSLGGDNEMDSEHGNKNDFHVILNESSLGSDNEMYLEHGKKMIFA